MVERRVAKFQAPKVNPLIQYQSTTPLTIQGLPVLGNLFDLDLSDSLTSLINIGQKYGSSLPHPTVAIEAS
jgi:hypothetical protein